MNTQLEAFKNKFGFEYAFKQYFEPTEEDVSFGIKDPYLIYGPFPKRMVEKICHNANMIIRDNRLKVKCTSFEGRFDTLLEISIKK